MTTITHTLTSSKEIKLQALDHVTYGSPLNKQFVKAAETGNTGAMISALIEGAQINEPKDIPCGGVAYHRAVENGHDDTANALRAYMEHLENASENDGPN